MTSRPAAAQYLRDTLASTRLVWAMPYPWFRSSPRRIQAWREVNVMPNREVIRDGRWLT